MKLHLKARLTFSKDLDEGASTLLKETLEKANTTILTKGAPEGEAPEASLLDISNEQALIAIDSGR